MIEGHENLPASAPQSMPDGEMAAEFLTGNLVIDAEHRQLFALLRAARTICIDMAHYPDCSSCSHSQQAHCETHLLKLLGDLLSFILDHFKTEEGMMRDSLLVMVDRLQCEEHIEDHAAISSKIERVISALDSRPTVELLREVNGVLAAWVMKHIATHDQALVNWIEREDSALRSGF